MTSFQANFIQNMKFYRKQAKISQAELAELCNVSNGTIGNIECGITKPSFDLIYLLAKALQITPADLFSESDKNADLILSDSQLAIVSETVNTAVNSAVTDAVSKALKDLKFKIKH